MPKFRTFSTRTHRARQRSRRRDDEPRIRFSPGLSGTTTRDYSCQHCRYSGRYGHEHKPRERP
jgi:hypothetical protein